VNQIGPLLPFILLAGVFYFLLIRPARARQREAQKVVSRLVPGARIMTTAGLFGTVAAVDGNEIDLEIAPGVTVRYVAAAVAKVIESPTDPGTTEEPRPSIIEGDTPEA
jgi:preprotein translocase subunit YajC